MTATRRRHDLVIAANRLPVDRITAPDGSVSWGRSPGGLVTAMDSVMRDRDGAWVGWDGETGEATRPFTHESMYLRPVPLSAVEVEQYYEGFSNDTLWPIYHDVIVQPSFHRDWWRTYVSGQPALRRRGRRGGGGGRDGVGAGLPAAARPPDGPRTATRPADRVVQPHPLPGGRAVRPDPLAARDPRRAPRRRLPRLPASGGRAELRPRLPPAAAGHDPQGHS